MDIVRLFDRAYRMQGDRPELRAAIRYEQRIILERADKDGVIDAASIRWLGEHNPVLGILRSAGVFPGKELRGRSFIPYAEFAAYIEAGRDVIEAKIASGINNDTLYDIHEAEMAALDIIEQMERCRTWMSPRQQDVFHYVMRRGLEMQAAVIAALAKRR